MVRRNNNYNGYRTGQASLAASNQREQQKQEKFNKFLNKNNKLEKDKISEELSEEKVESEEIKLSDDKKETIEVESSNINEKITEITNENLDANYKTKAENYNAQKEEADKYYADKVEEADKYYADKVKEGNEYYDNIDSLIKETCDDERKKVREEIKEQITKAKAEAQEIISNAKIDIDLDKRQLETQKKEIDQKARELNEKQKTYNEDFAKLESDKITYRIEILEDVKKEIQDLKDENEKLSKQLKRIEKELTASKEDAKFYQDATSTLNLALGEKREFELEIERLKDLNKRLEEVAQKKETKIIELETERVRYMGNDATDLISKNKSLEKELEELRDFKAQQPSPTHIEELEEKANERDNFENLYRNEKTTRKILEEENRELREIKEEIESKRKFIKILECQKDELQRELDRTLSMYQNRNETIFANLSKIDEEHEQKQYPSIIKTQNITLEKLCNDFRGYLAHRKDEKQFYYDIETIRTFIAGFASSKLAILEGLSGTGKSSLPRNFTDFMGSELAEIQVQSSWRDKNDLLGFYNDFQKKYKETDFLQALYKAAKDKNNIYCILLDEMNLSRVEYYFADLLSILQKPRNEWDLTLIADYASIPGVAPELIKEGKLRVSENVWFVGTANNDDSTCTISDKVYDRSVVINFSEKGKKDNMTSYAPPYKMNYTDFNTLLDNAKNFKKIEDEVRFEEMIAYLDTEIKNRFELTFGNRIEEQLRLFVPVYVACGGTVDEAVDAIFSRKILRKLDNEYDEEIKKQLKEFSDDIENKGYAMFMTFNRIEKMVKKI